MSRQYTRQRAKSGKCSPPTRKSSGKTTILAADDHQARAWETDVEKAARLAIGEERRAARSERARAGAAARKEAKETERMEELSLAAAIENSLAPPSPNDAGARAAAAAQVVKPEGKGKAMAKGKAKAEGKAMAKAKAKGKGKGKGKCAMPVAMFLEGECSMSLAMVLRGGKARAFRGALFRRSRPGAVRVADPPLARGHVPERSSAGAREVCSRS